MSFCDSVAQLYRHGPPRSIDANQILKGEELWSPAGRRGAYVLRAWFAETGRHAVSGRQHMLAGDFRFLNYKHAKLVADVTGKATSAAMGSLEDFGLGFRSIARFPDIAR